MATVNGRPPSRKGAAFRRQTYEYMRNGRLVVAKWPKARGKPKSPVTLEQNEWFRQAKTALKYMDAQAQNSALIISENSPLYPRDVLMSAIAGRLFGELNIDGKRWVPMTRLQDISADLDDLLGSTPGTIMFRGAQLWQGITPPADPSLLTYDPTNATPLWADPAVTGGLTWTRTRPNGSFATASIATKGIVIEPASDFTVTAMAAYIDAFTGGTYAGRIWRLNSSNVQQNFIGGTGIWTAPDGLAHWVQLPTTAPFTLTAGNRYALAWTRLNAGNTYVFQLGLCDGDQDWDALPYIPYATGGNPIQGANVAKTNPVAGDTWSTFPGPQFSLGFRIGISDS